MPLYTILLVILILMLLGALPPGHIARCGIMGPRGALGTVEVVSLILMLLGKL